LSELLRPEPPRSWVDRARDALDAVRTRPAAAAGAVVALAVVAVIAVAIMLGVARSGASAARSAPVEAELPFAAGAASGATSSTTTVPSLVVHVAGAVVDPGVHRLAAGARVVDAIDAAGGLTADADPDRVNLAAPLADGSRIYVLRRGEVAPPSLHDAAPSSGPLGGDAGPLDLNAATLTQLDALPGVGPATAQAIIDHRARVGRFRSVEELLDVRGIGPAKLEQLRPLVRV
jgi:competence protein ComEA